MKQFRVGLAAVVATIAALVAVGCGGGDEGVTKKTKKIDPQQVKGEITVPATVGVNEPILRAVAPEFEKKYPNIKVKVVGINYLNVYERQLVDLKSKRGNLDLLTHTPSFFSI